MVDFGQRKLVPNTLIVQTPRYGMVDFGQRKQANSHFPVFKYQPAD
jgi:hypothetical protein